MGLHHYKLSVTTDGSGDGTATGPNVLGWLYAVQVTQGTWTDDQADITISTVNSDGAATQLTITDLGASAMYYPRIVGHSNAGAALTDKTQYPLLAGVLKVTVAQGGDTLTGSVVIYWFD